MIFVSVDVTQSHAREEVTSSQNSMPEDSFLVTERPIKEELLHGLHGKSANHRLVCLNAWSPAARVILQSFKIIRR